MHAGWTQNSDAEVADDRRNQDWNRARREVGKYLGVDIERRKGRVRMVEISDRRRGHSRRTTERHWTSARERLESRGQDVTHPPVTEDRRNEAAAEVAAQPTVVVVVAVVSRRTGGLWRSFSTVRLVSFVFGVSVHVL
jgi:hypothetical protein